MARILKWKTVVTINYCEGKITFPALTKVVEVPDRGGVKPEEVIHFAKVYCYQNNLIYVSCDGQKVERQEGE